MGDRGGGVGVGEQLQVGGWVWVWVGVQKRGGQEVEKEGRVLGEGVERTGHGCVVSCWKHGFCKASTRTTQGPPMNVQYCIRPVPPFPPTKQYPTITSQLTSQRPTHPPHTPGGAPHSLTGVVLRGDLCGVPQQDLTGV